MRIVPARRVSGRLRLPGDKSVSHRAAMIAALARGDSRITNFSTSQDCTATLACLRELGVFVGRDETSVLIRGVGSGGLYVPLAPLDCGNSGSTMRMLAGVLAAQNFESQLTGDRSLCARPMERVITPLEMMGARVHSEAGCAPLRIIGRRPLAPVSYEMTIASAQVKSCILLAGLGARGRTEVIEKLGATRDHTERMLRWFGAAVETKIEDREGAPAEIITIEGLAQLSARDVTIAGDISSATFFMAAAALLPGSSLLITDVGLNRTRAQIIETLRQLGALVHLERMRDECNEPLGNIHVSGSGDLAPVDGSEANILRGPLIAQLIDELPMLAVVGTQVEGGMIIRDAAELRVKESDRIRAITANLRAMGAEVEEYADGLRIAGGRRLRGARIDAQGDHRIAMAFTVAALIAEGESEIIGAECVRVSFPEFFQLLESVVER